ncbi:hypothetical protein BX600DRAFT_52367 [Xylariales sp. PMI_506]|nr:hypothetical protein BX600DRAFT_52367 [Xylariales sp. PMI_506]
MEGIMETGLPGEMVLTRRGLHLFKHKYKGTGFVNLSMDSANICSAKEKSDQPMKKLKFRTHRLKNRQPSAGGRSLPGTPQTHDICLTGPDSPISISSNFSHYDPADDYAAPASSRQRQAARSSSAKPKGTGAAPKSQRKRTTPPPQQVDDFLEDVPKSLGDWAILHCPMELSSGQKMALKTYLEWLPRRTYPFQIWDAMTHHPLRSSNPLVSLFRDDTSLQSAICMGAVSAFWSGTDTDLVKVTHYSTKLCSLINVMLGELEHQPRESILIQSVATLALLAHLRNNYAEWHIHMQGLRQLITSSKYETISDPCVRWIVHRLVLKNLVSILYQSPADIDFSFSLPERT